MTLTVFQGYRCVRIINCNLFLFFILVHRSFKHCMVLTFNKEILYSMLCAECLWQSGNWHSGDNFRMKFSLTHSVPQNEGLIPRSCAHATRGVRPSFCELYCHCLRKHSQTEIGFKTNVLLMKGENSTTSFCIVLTFKSMEIHWLFKKILVFWSIGYRLYMDVDSEHKVADSDDGWLLDSE